MMITCTSNHIERVIYNYSLRQRNDEVRFEVALTHAKRHSKYSHVYTSQNLHSHLHIHQRIISLP